MYETRSNRPTRDGRLSCSLREVGYVYLQREVALHGGLFILQGLVARPVNLDFIQELLRHFTELFSICDFAQLELDLIVRLQLLHLEGHKRERNREL